MEASSPCTARGIASSCTRSTSRARICCCGECWRRFQWWRSTARRRLRAGPRRGGRAGEAGYCAGVDAVDRRAGRVGGADRSRASGSRSASRRGSPATSRSSPRPARWAARRSPRRNSPSTPTSTRPRSAATSPASASSASAASATTSSRWSREIRKILRTSGQHNIALFGAGNLGQAIASSDIFADHGFQVVAMFDVDRDVVGTEVGDLRVRDFSDLEAVVAEQEIVVGVLAVPAGGRPGRRRPPGRGRRQDHLQLLRAAAPGAARGDRPHLQPRRRPALRALLLPDLRTALVPRPRPRSGEVRVLDRLHDRPRGGVRDPRPGDAGAGASLRGRQRRLPGAMTCWPSRRPAS